MAGIRYHWKWVGAVMASIQSIDEIERVTYISNLQASRIKVHNQLGTPGAKTIEGLWWKQYAGVGGFLSVSNIALQPISATVSLLDSTGSFFVTKTLSLGAHQTTVLDLGQLISGSKSTEGGIRITWNGVPWAVTAQAGMEDDATGYSATLPLTEFPEVSSVDAPSAPSAYDSAGLMIGAQDPAMSFPESTTFTVYEAMRNLTGHALSAQVAATYQSGTVPITTVLGTFTLPPYGAMQLDMPALLKAANVAVNGELNLRTSFAGKYSDLIIATGSVDQSMDYVFAVSPSIEQKGNSRILCYWQALNDTSTMISLWNYSAAAQNLLVTFYFDGRSYLYPVTLNARQSTTLDVAQIIHDQMPDVSGNILPLYVHEGRATLSGAGGTLDMIEVAANVSTYNVRNATCGVECYSCNGVGDAWVDAAIFTLDVKHSQTVTPWIMLQDGGGTKVYPGSPAWSSSNASVASGLVSGVSAGVAYTYAGVTSGYPGAGEWCTGGTNQPVSCPNSPEFTPSQVTVTQPDQTPVITGIDPSVWDSSASTPVTTPGVTFSGQYFGTNAPTLTFSDSRISYSLSSYNDSQIVANVTVAAGTPSEDVGVSVTNNGYGGLAFNGTSSGSSATSAPVYATVQAEPTSPALVVAYSSYIPSDHISGPSGCVYGSTAVQYIFKGDGGYGSFRTTETALFNPATLSISDFFPMTGQTRQYAYGSPANGSTLSSLDEDGIPNDCHLWNQSAQASYSNFSYTPLNEGTNIGAIQFYGSASNPLATTWAAISWNMTTTINVSNPSKPTASVNYNHTCYPAHQVKVGPNNTVVYSYTPPYNNTFYIGECLAFGVNLLTEVTGTTGSVPIQ